MNELQRVTDIDEVIKYTERRAEGCHQMASAYHTDEGVYLQEETRYQYRAILWENIHEWLEELKERRKKKRSHGEWLYNRYDGNPNIGNWHCSECRHIVFGGYSQKPCYNFCPNCGSDNRKKEDEPHGS